MAGHDAEYFRNRRRAQGVAERDPFAHPRFVARGQELQRLMALPAPQWPLDVFDQAISIERLMMAQPLQQQRKDTAGDLCACGCGKRHNHNIPMTTPSQYGHGFNVHYFSSDACKGKYVRERKAT